MIYLLNWRIWAALGLAAVLAYSHITVYKAGGNAVQVKFDVYKMAAEMASKAAIEQARTTEQEWQTKLNQERDNAAKREIQLRADADSAHHANDGLRDQLSATARRIAESSPASCATALPTYSELLDNCAARYRQLGEAAQGHVSDIETLINSWPSSKIDTSNKPQQR